jgi:hypothetical protein
MSKDMKVKVLQSDQVHCDEGMNTGTNKYEKFQIPNTDPCMCAHIEEYMLKNFPSYAFSFPKNLSIVVMRKKSEMLFKIK